MPLREIEEQEGNDRADRRERISGKIGWLTTAVGAVAGCVIGFFVGLSMIPPPDPNAMVDLTGIDDPFIGAGVGLIIGIAVGWAGWFIARELLANWPRLSRLADRK